MPETIYELAKRMCNSFKSCNDCPMNKAKDECCLIDLIGITPAHAGKSRGRPKSHV